MREIDYVGGFYKLGLEMVCVTYLFLFHWSELSYMPLLMAWEAEKGNLSLYPGGRDPGLGSS